MLTSLTFWGVIAAGATAYWLLPRFRDWILFLGSAAYLAFFDWKSVLVAFGLSSAAFVSTQKPRFKKRWLVIATGVLAGGYLAAYKYVPPLIASDKSALHAIVVPLGASYFTFKLIHYLIEASRGDLPPHKYASFMAYMFFLPMFTAGPIERFEAFPENRKEKFSWNQFYLASTRVADGLVKKLVIVDLFFDRTSKYHEGQSLWQAIPLVMPACSLDQLLAHTNTIHPLFVWQFVINRFFMWYVDFSAYCDIAIGAGLFFGIKLCENFDYPFLVTNVGDFWKRYHMSLSTWCQHYVYFPVLGWTRNAHLALFCSMIAIGLWHAGNLNYLCWGLYQASLLWTYLAWSRWKRKRIAIASKTLPKGSPKPFAWTNSWAVDFAGGVYTFLGTCASAAFPATQEKGINAAFKIFGALFGIHT